MYKLTNISMKKDNADTEFNFKIKISVVNEYKKTIF